MLSGPHHFLNGKFFSTSASRSSGVAGQAIKTSGPRACRAINSSVWPIIDFRPAVAMPTAMLSFGLEYISRIERSADCNVVACHELIDQKMTIRLGFLSASECHNPQYCLTKPELAP